MSFADTLPPTATVAAIAAADTIDNIFFLSIITPFAITAYTNI
jgi:hypothetical protein